MTYVIPYVYRSLTAAGVNIISNVQWQDIQAAALSPRTSTASPVPPMLTGVYNPVDWVVGPCRVQLSDVSEPFPEKASKEVVDASRDGAALIVCGKFTAK
jgi:hypothetical protein